ncbi:hydroxyproline O-galactosyltransferase HPGT1-like isoform X5 [Citrus sinensis]|nr:hydroxyproline O-galactosyltransferase HPGT1-like isoform X5 [Citrus sinensis]XP_024045047.1 hydroxyproline O-galactosyltransferase HPGT1 isoform X5 [Citrus x clementina]
MQNYSVVSVDETLKLIACREQQMRLSAIEMDLAAARQEGFVSGSLSQNDTQHSKKRHLAVIGIITTFGRKKNRDAIREAWMSTGAALRELQDNKGIVVRFVIGRSANRGDSFDTEIDSENSQTNDFIILDDHVEAPEELAKKMKSFFVHAVEKWDAEFYTKVNDDVYVNIGRRGGTNQTGGNLVMENGTFDMLLVTCIPFHVLWHSISQLIGLFFKHMPMMISVPDHGSLGLMLTMWTIRSFAAPHGPQAQESYAQLCDLTCMLVLKTNCIGRGEEGHCFPAFVSNACCREPVKNRRSQRTEV